MLETCAVTLGRPMMDARAVLPGPASSFSTSLTSIASTRLPKPVVPALSPFFKKEWEKLGLHTDYLSMRHPYAVIAAAGESNRYMDLLHRIRNSFAHGRFTVAGDHGEYYFYFEDVKETNGSTCVLARACLTKSGMSRLLVFLTREKGSAAGFESIIETH